MKLQPFASLLFLAGLISSAPAEQPAPAALPFEPAQLLATLPVAPDDWTLTDSKADTSLGEWLATKATRVFQAPLRPTNASSPGTPTPPGEVEVSVVDTAGFAPSLADFADFTPGKNGIVEKKLIGSLPAIVITSEPGRQITQILISSRYLVETTLTNLPTQHVEDWLRRLHFDALPANSAALSAQPREFRLSHLDELHPENNRSYRVSTTDSTRLEAFLKTLPPEKSER